VTEAISESRERQGCIRIKAEANDERKIIAMGDLCMKAAFPGRKEGTEFQDRSLRLTVATNRADGNHNA
jgi:hypothetical protein